MGRWRKLAAMRWCAIVAILLAVPAGAEDGLRPGRYAVSVEVTLPNIATRDYGFETEICWQGPDAPGMPLGPLGPGPLGSCPAAARDTGEGASVITTCPGPNAGFATAAYRRTAAGFTGRVDMNLGGKNMRVGEVQRGRWLGPC